MVAAVSLYGFLLLRGRPDLPPAGPSSRVVAADGIPVRDRIDRDLVVAGRRVGDPVALTIESGPGGPRRTLETRLVPFYAASPVPVVFLLSGLLSAAIGFVVFALRHGDPRARIFFAVSLAFAAAVMVNGDTYGVRGSGLTVVPGFLFNAAYPMAPALLLAFALTFVPLRRPPALLATLAPGLVLGALANVSFAEALSGRIAAASALRHAYDALFRGFIALALLGSAAAFLAALLRSPSDETRSQVKWILTGLAAGLLPFVAFYQVPQVAGLRPVLSEEVASLFFLLIPPAFAIAIVKHRLLCVDVVINRGLVYTPLTMLTAAIYLLSVEGLRAAFARGPGRAEGWIAPVAAVVAAAVFQASRKRVQALVDRAFFRQAYDYRKAVARFAAEAPRLLDGRALFELFRSEIDGALAPERVTAWIEAAAGSGDAAGAGTADPVVLREMPADPGAAERAVLCSLVPGRIYGRRAAVRDAAPADLSRSEDLPAAAGDLVVPLDLGAAGLRGAVGLGPRKSGRPYSSDDLELLATLAAELGLGIGRVRLQEQVIYERASREKLDELDRLKTQFVSEVSHELRTPLTSIQGLSELLLAGGEADEERRARLLRVMAEECGRLSRFLHNVLDFGRIERGVQSYRLRREALQPLVRSVVDLVREARASKTVALEVSLPPEPVEADVDADAVRQALLNLVDNAVKYSGDGRRVTVSLGVEGDRVALRVADEGIGLSDEDRDRIFDAFYRAPEAVRRDPRGVGLGLKIVRHIMDAHGGRVTVASERGRGSIFTLEFPKP